MRVLSGRFPGIEINEAVAVVAAKTIDDDVVIAAQHALRRRVSRNRTARVRVDEDVVLMSLLTGWLCPSVEAGMFIAQRAFAPITTVL